MPRQLFEGMWKPIEENLQLADHPVDVADLGPPGSRGRRCQRQAVDGSQRPGRQLGRSDRVVHDLEVVSDVHG